MSLIDQSISSQLRVANDRIAELEEQLAASHKENTRLRHIWQIIAGTKDGPDMTKSNKDIASDALAWRGM